MNDLTVDVPALFAALLAEQGLPDDFPSDVASVAEHAATEVLRDLSVGGARLDYRDRAFQTLDPASSTDLDQAFFAFLEGETVVLQYALADIAAYAPRGGVVEAEAFRRAVTVYAPNRKVPLYPPVLSQHAASLLPDGPRPAVVVEVGIDPSGATSVRRIDRAVIESKAKLAYETTDPADLGPAVNELHRRIVADEARRGATKVDWPEQEIVVDPSGTYQLELRTLRPSEEVNASLSLAVNLALADVMLRARTGLFRVMPGPDAHHERALRRTADALGIPWRNNQSFRDILATLHPSQPTHAKFLLEARRSGRGASYACFSPHETPFHSALAATYAHATAPMRRLADRYVLELCLELCSQRDAQTSVQHTAELADFESVLAAMPALMAGGERRARAVESGALDILETVAMIGHVGEVYAATVIEEGESGVTFQITDPPVRARAKRPRLTYMSDTQDLSGSQIQVRLIEVDPARRLVRFELLNEGSLSS